MQTINVNQLAQQMRLRKEQGEKPFILFLGAGASITSGGSTMDNLIKQFLIDFNLESNDDIEKMDENERFEKFIYGMDTLDQIDRYTWLRLVFKNGQPSVGYIALTRLIENGFFETIITTNWDSFLDMSLSQSNKVSNKKEYRFYVRGVDQDNFITRGFRVHNTPRIKILKLHGELYSPVIFVTKKDTSSFPNEIAGLLKDFFKNYSIIMVGYSISDLDVQRCMENDSNTLIFISPKIPTDASFEMTIKKFNHVFQVPDQEKDFDVFMCKLCKLLLSEDVQQPSQINLSNNKVREKLNQISTDAKTILKNSDWLGNYLENRQLN